ncbi:MAG: hypothetical protein PHO32_04865, partial [Candidatus Cloacimonetes bacterium]|nr:hypothetical protein [Candidatus Cloacimonadota bacterium]
DNGYSGIFAYGGESVLSLPTRMHECSVGGGGGGYQNYYANSGTYSASGGGGGGYGTSGEDGYPRVFGPGGLGGTTYGNSIDNSIFMGSGGGAGGTSRGDWQVNGGAGGNGGGVIYITARSMVNHGSISANGNNGSNGIHGNYYNLCAGGGGGGSGGQVKITSLSLINNSQILSLGGSGGYASRGFNVTGTYYSANGGIGGSGRIAIKGVSVNNANINPLPVTSPLSSTSTIRFISSITSGVIAPGSSLQVQLTQIIPNIYVGSYSDTLYIQSNDITLPSLPIIISLNILPGYISISPPQLSVNINASSNTQCRDLTMINTGIGQFNYAIVDSITSYDNLIAYYPFSGNASDIGTFQHNAVNYNAVLTNDRFDNANNAYYFNGSNSYLEIDPIPSELLGNQPFSVSFWVKPDNDDFGWYLTFGSPNTDQGYHIGSRVTGNNLIYGYWNHGVNTNVSRTANQWNHFVITIDGVTQKIYKNGLLAYSNGLNGSIPNITEGVIRIGRQLGSINEFAKGAIDDVSIFSAVLSDTEIQKMYTSNQIVSYNPMTGIVPASGQQTVIVSVDGSTLSEGIHNESTMILSNASSENSPLCIPITIRVDITPPATPSGLTFDEGQSDMNQIFLGWTANALADSVHSYNIYRRGVHDAAWVLNGIVNADQTWFIDNQFTGLDTTAVYYKVTAVDWVENESVASGEVLAWLQRFPAPTGLTMEIIRNRHVKLTWNPVTQTISGNPGTPSCYVIYRSNTPSPIENFYFVGAVDATTFTHNWAAWFIEQNKQFYVVTAYSGNFEDLRAVADSRREWKYGELESMLQRTPHVIQNPK